MRGILGSEAIWFVDEKYFCLDCLMVVDTIGTS